MKKYFVPTQDITTYELAFIFGMMGTGVSGCPSLNGTLFKPEEWGKLHPRIKSHFQDKPCPPALSPPQKST